MKKREFISLCFKFNDFIYTEHFKELEVAHNTIYNVFKALYILTKGCIRDLLYNRFKLHLFSYYYKQYAGRNVFFSPTLNNRRAVERIAEKTEKAYHITDIHDSRQFPVFRVYLYSLIYVFSVIRQYIEMDSGIKKTVAGNILINYILTTGYFIVFCRICKNASMQSVILSNDHTFINRPLIRATQMYHVKSLYTQHASVADYYPQLSCTYSVLDGLDSMAKYASNDKSLDHTTILLLGASRYDGLVSAREKITHNKKRIGIGINGLDDYETIQEICKKILADLPGYEIIIRAHPNWAKSKVQMPNVTWTSALDEEIRVFFNRIDILISNDSCVHFDAVKYGVPTVMYTLNKDGFSDQYSYVRSGFVKYIPDYITLVSYLKSGEYYIPAIDLVRKYDNSYKREYEGNASYIIAEFINSHFDLMALRKEYNLEKIETEIGTFYQIP